MPYELVSIQKTRWYQSPLPWIGLAAAASLAFLALPRAQGLYNQWREHRRVARAAEYLRKREYKEAVVNARGALALNPHSVEATRIIAKSLEGLNLPEAVNVRRQLDAIDGHDVENSLALATGAWKGGNREAVKRLLTDLPPTGHNTPTYHELSARLAASESAIPQAIEHWMEATRLAPEREDYRLELAAARLKSTVPAERDAALQELEQSSAAPATRVPALRFLLTDASAAHQTSRTVELSTSLVAEPSATFADRLQHLTLLHSHRRPGFGAYLTELQQSCTGDPLQIYQVLNWMNQHQLALLVPEWAATLPPDALSMPQIRTTLAEADARASNWGKLNERLEKEGWDQFDYLRLAFLSRARERLNDANGARAAWVNAVAAAQADPAHLEILGRTVLGWGSDRKAEEVLRKRAAAKNCPRWVADFIWTAALKARDSARLYEASRAILSTDPKSLTARNNFIALSLLTASGSDDPRQLAEALYAEGGKDPLIATTYGLSLYQQGRSADAVNVMKSFSAEQLEAPQVALYEGIFLAGAGRFAEAQKYLELGAGARMLPEERALFERAQSAAPAAPIGPLDRTRRDTAQLYKECQQTFLSHPQDLTARKNYVTLALLTGQNAELAHQLARKLQEQHLADATAARANAANVEVAAICGLSLFQQGKVADAISLLKLFPLEQLRSPAVALYPGLFFAAAGNKNEAAPFLQIAAGTTLFPEEKALLANAQSGAVAPAATPVAVAPARPAVPLPPVAAIDRTRRDTVQLFKEARERMLAEPKNVAARRNYLLLSLLTGQSAESARQLARALYQERPTDPEAVSIHGLSLYQQGKKDEAAALMASLPAAQLQQPIIALYHSYFLAGTGQGARAREFAQFAARVPLLPEETVFLQAVQRFSTPLGQ